MKPWIALVVVLLTGAVSAAEHPPVVLDHEKLFSKVAIERIEKLADELRAMYQIDLCIETLKEAKGVPPTAPRTMKPREVTRKLREAAQDRADDLNVRGLYVLVTMEPKHVTVIAYPVGLEGPWGITSNYKREEMRKTLARMLDSDPSAGLIHAVEEYRASLPPPDKPSPLRAWPALVAAGALLGFWLLLRLIRARFRERLPIYQPAMQGSIFGVPAGFWIHDCLFQAERPVAAPTVVVEEAVVAVEPVVETPAEPERVPAAPGEEHP